MAITVVQPKTTPYNMTHITCVYNTVRQSTQPSQLRVPLPFQMRGKPGRQVTSKPQSRLLPELSICRIITVFSLF